MLGHCGRSQQPMIADRDPPDLQRRLRRGSARAPRRGRRAAPRRRRRRSPGCSKHAEDELLAFYAFPREHWPKLRSTNPLERVNKEIGRRSDVVGIYPNDQALIRLAGMLLIEQNDEWLVQRRYLSEHSIQLVLSTLDGSRTSTLEQQQQGGDRAQRRLSSERPHRRSASYTTKREVSTAVATDCRGRWPATAWALPTRTLLAEGGRSSRSLILLSPVARLSLHRPPRRPVRCPKSSHQSCSSAGGRSEVASPAARLNGRVRMADAPRHGGHRSELGRSYGRRDSQGEPG